MKNWNEIRNTGCFRGKPRIRLVDGKWRVLSGLDGNEALIHEAVRFARRANANAEQPGRKVK